MYLQRLKFQVTLAGMGDASEKLVRRWTGVRLWSLSTN